MSDLDFKKFKNNVLTFLATEGLIILITFIFMAGSLKETMSQNTARIAQLEQEKADKEVIIEALKSMNTYLQQIDKRTDRIERRLDTYPQ